MLTPLMLDDTRKLAAWDGRWLPEQRRGSACAGRVENLLDVLKSGTFATESLAWPKSVDAIAKRGACRKRRQSRRLYQNKKAAKRPYRI